MLGGLGSPRFLHYTHHSVRKGLEGRDGRDAQDIWQVCLLGSDTEVVENHVSLFVFEWCAVGFCFLGFLDVGEDFFVHFTRWFTLLCTGLSQ